MANNSDSLIFPVHFNMDDAIKGAEDAFKSKEKQLDKMFSANINLTISPKSIDNLEDVQKRLKEIRLQPVTPETRNAIRVLVKELEGLAKILEKVDRLNVNSSRSASQISSTQALEAQRRARTAQIEANTLRQEEAAQERLRQARLRTQKAQLDLIRAQERGTRASNNQTKAFHSQANMLNGLKQTMGAYVSLLGAKTLATNIREVTAEFELQKVALTAILQDKAKADMLFSQVVDLAVKSPFQIKEMVSFTKQLAAYRINTEDLYDTTRRLADVSSGLGVEMSRIILAYGQVSAASVLRGQEVRQFTEAGIPLIQLLAEKFEELNGKAVTTGEVFELISQRKVSFEMVKEVFEDMTNAGGIFYDMQAKQADTLFGVYSNLKDAWDVAFNEIGRENLSLMKGIGEALTDLGENWRTLESVLVTAAASLSAYKIALLLSASSTNTLTVATARQIVADRARLSQSPALITSILGQSNASKLASFNANILAISKARLATANNIVTRSFYRLTTAMLTNPYIALLAGVTALVVGMYSFSDAAVSVDERIDRLNKSVANFTSSSSKVDDLISSYDSLSDVVNRTESQQKKLNAVVRELAKLYPEAVAKVDEYGTALDITIGKVRDLTKAERELKLEIAERNIVDTDTQIKQKEEQLKRIQRIIDSRTLSGKPITQSGEIQSEIPLSLNALEKFSKQADKLRGEIEQLRAASSGAKDELDNLGKTKTIDALSGWQKILEDSGQYTREAINDLAEFPKAIEDVAKEYKNATKDVEIYSRTLSSAGESEKASVRSGYNAAKERQKAYIGILKALNQVAILDDKKTSKKDPRVEALEYELKLIKEVHSRYQQLAKDMPKASAIEKITELYSDIKPVTLEYAFTDEDLQKQYRTFLTKMQALGVKNPVLQPFKLELSDIEFKRFNDNLSERLKKMGEKLEQQQKANNFFEKLIGAGMDSQLATSVTMSYYGFSASDLRETMISELEAGLGGINVDLTPDGTIDFDKIIKKIDLNEKLAPNMKEAYIDLAKSIRDEDAKTIESLYSNLNKYSEYEKKRLYILNVSREERRKIQSSAVGESQKADLLLQSRSKEDRALASLEYDVFKESELYATMFENLDKISTASLDAIRSKLELFKQSSKDNLDPTQIRELTRSFEKIDEEFRSRNPFQSMIESIGQYREQARLAADANKRIADINSQLASSTTALAMARSKQSQAREAGQDSSVYDAAVDATSKHIRELEKQLGVQLKITNEAKKTKDILGEAVLNLGDKLGGIDSSIGDFGETLGMLGVDMDSELGATFGDLQNVIGGAAQAAGGFGKVMKGDLSGIGDMIKGTGKQIQGFVGIFTGINRRVARANKEIKKQAEIIRELDLEYKKLEKSMNNLLGVNWAQNNADQIRLLEAQVIATQKQLEAERSKGKKKDEEKMREYEDQIQEIQDRIVERQKAFSEQLLGTNVGDAARSFASAWLDAYLSFNDTTQAIEDRMKDMMKNMLIEAILGKVIQDYVAKMFDEVGQVWDRRTEFNREAGDKILDEDKKWLMANKDKWMTPIDKLMEAGWSDKMLDWGYSDAMIDALTAAGIATKEILTPNKDKIQQLVGGIGTNASDLNDILTAVLDGLDLSGLMDIKDNGLTGLSKAVGSMTEDTALVLASAANSSLYYNVGQYNELVLIRDILTRWESDRGLGVASTDQSSGIGGLIAIQSLALNELQKANISLVDIVASNREIQELFVSLTSPLGSRSGTRAINVNI